jgi:peroxiredoxin
MACNSTKKGYVITGIIEDAGNGIAILSTSIDNEVKSVDTVAMIDDQFTFEGEMPDVRHASITIIPEGKERASISFIIENSSIKVSARWSDVVGESIYRRFRNAAVIGSRNNDFVDTMNHIPLEVRERPEHEEFVRRYNEAVTLYAEGRIDEYYLIRTDIQPLEDHYRTIATREQITMLKANKDIPAAAYYLTILKTFMSMREIEDVFNALNKHVRQSEMACGIRRYIENSRRIQPGQPAPDFTLTQPDGTSLSLSDLQGKIVILDFWASWCQPCRRSFPMMMNFYNKYKDKQVEILGISTDSNPEVWKKAIVDEGITWPQVIDESLTEKHSRNVASLYAVPHLPLLVLVDQQGVIAAYGMDKHDLEALVSELLEDSF